MVDTNLQMVEDKEEEFGLRNARQDADRSLYLLDPFVLKGTDNKPIPKVTNVTMNEPRIFAEKVMSIINGATMQAVAKGRQLSETDKVNVQNFMDDLLTTIDNRLIKRGRTMLRPFITEQNCLRGTIVTRNMLMEAGGKFVPDVLQADSRYATYEYDANGLAWVNAVTHRNERMLKSEYPKATNIPNGKKIKVRDFWDGKINEVYADGKKIFDQPNTYGYPPWVVVESSAGPALADEDFFVYRAESIYATVRGLYPELNRLASIVQTLSVWSFLGPMQYESELGEMAAKPEQSPYGEKTVLPVEKGGGYKPFPINDVKQATRLFQYLLLSAIQRATFSNMEYGTLSMPLSSVAIAKMMAQRASIIQSRMYDQGSYYRQTARMFVDQYIAGGYTAELGEEGEEREYAPADLDKKFTMLYKFYSISPEQDAANHSMAASIRPGLLSDDTIRRDILHLENPEEEDAKVNAQAARQSDMAINLFERGHDLIDLAGEPGAEKYYIEAEFVLQQLEVILRQRMSGNPIGFGDGASAPTGTATPTMPVFGGGGGNANVSGEEDMGSEEQEERSDSRAVTVRRQTAEG